MNEEAAAPYTWIANVPLPTYVLRVLDDDILLVTVNPIARAMNPSIEQLFGRSMLPFYKDRPDLIEDARRCVTERREITRETTVHRFTQTTTLLLRLTLVPSGARDVLLYYQDISPKAVTDAALLESEQRYLKLIESMPDGLVLLRAEDGALLWVNPAAKRLFDWADKGPTLGSTALLPSGARLLDPSGAPTTLLAIAGAGGPGRYELVGAGRRWLRISSQPLQAEVPAVVLVIVDVTAEVASERARKQAAEQLDRALDAGRMGVWEWRPAVDVGNWSASLDRVFDLPQREPGVASFLNHVHEDDRPALLDLLQRVLAGRAGEQVDLECRLRGVGGAVRWARITGRGTGSGDELELRGTVIDITERRRLEQELSRAQRLESIGRLAGGVAHDFNNLLAAVLGSVELIEESPQGDITDDLDVIKHAALRGRDLTNQLLTFARRQSADLKRIDLGALVTEVERMLRRLVGDPVDLRVRAARGVFIVADAAQIEQLIVNLVINARDAMPDGGQLEVVLEPRDVSGRAELPDGRYAALVVSDTGHGMSEATLKNVFEPFFTTKRTGTGLGLATCYGIAKELGGHIDIASQPGKGTVFTVLVPLGAAAAPAEEEATPRQTLRGNRRTLVVDDNPLVLSVTERMLSGLGLEVVAASSAEEARVVAASRPIDLLICDVAMPVCNGPDLAAELRARNPGLRCLFVSGYAPSEGGVTPHLRKPFRKIELLRAILQILAEPDAQSV